MQENKKSKNNIRAGDMVLGMHDALVSLTGLIAGMAVATDDGGVIVLTGIISSVVAAMSMAASNYLAAKANNLGMRRAITSGMYTGIAYIITCAILILPFVLENDVRSALAWTFVIAISIIFIFNLCVARISRRPFWGRFIEMLGVCGGVSIIAFIIGDLAQHLLGIQI